MDALDLPVREVEDRFRWARRQGHPWYPWPDVEVSAWRAALEEIERVTRDVLVEGVAEWRGPGGQGRESPAVATRDAAHRPPPALAGLSPGERALSVAAFTSGMGPLLGFWAEGGRLGVHGAAAAILALHLAHGRARARGLRALIHHAVATLDDAGLPSVLLKGADTAWRVFPDPGTRPSSDVDVLVDPERIEVAEEALAAAGYRCESPRVPQQDRSTWLPPGAGKEVRSLYLTHRDNPMSVDLHGTLDRTVRGVIPVRFGPAQALPRVSGPHATGRAERLAEPLLTAFHATHTGDSFMSPTMVRLTELVFLIRRGTESGELSWDGLGETLEAAGAERFAFLSLALTERLAPGTVDPDLRRRLERRTPTALRRAVGRLTPATVQKLEGFGRRFVWVGGAGELLRTVRGSVLPYSVPRTRSQVLRLYRHRWWNVRSRIARWMGRGAEGEG